MIYSCKYCNFHTNRKNNFNDHNLTKKHQNNIILSKKEKYKCQKCNKSYLTSVSLKKHTIICDTNNNQINKTELNNNLNTNLNNNIIVNPELNNKLNTNTNINSNNNPIIGTEKNNVVNYNIKEKIIINNKKKCITAFSASTILNNFFFKAPILETHKNYKIFLYSTKNDEIITNNEFMQNLTYDYNNNFLDRFLGNIIIKCYKKNNPDEQSIWTTDTSRTNYVIRQLVNNKLSWFRDINAIQTNKIIIEPILKILKECIHDFLKVPILNLNENERILQFDRNQTLAKIILYIDNPKIYKNIHNYISTYFYFNKSKVIIDVS